MKQLDRFIPNRSAMDFDYAHYMLTEGWKEKENSISSPSKEAYRKRMKEVFGMNRSRILAFSNKPPAPIPCTTNQLDLDHAFVVNHRRRRIPQVYKLCSVIMSYDSPFIMSSNWLFYAYKLHILYTMIFRMLWYNDALVEKLCCLCGLC